MIDLRKTLEIAKTALTSAKIDFALIGGFALAAHGIHRATQDIDLLVDGAKKDEIKTIFCARGFTLEYESNEVLQFCGIGYLDCLLAHRPLSLEMLHSSRDLELLGVPVVKAEGIIGLKIQAYNNNPSRKLRDLADIQELINLPGLDVNMVREYAELFKVWAEIKGLIK